MTSTKRTSNELTLTISSFDIPLCSVSSSFSTARDISVRSGGGGSSCMGARLAEQPLTPIFAWAPANGTQRWPAHTSHGSSTTAAGLRLTRPRQREIHRLWNDMFGSTRSHPLPMWWTFLKNALAQSASHEYYSNSSTSVGPVLFRNSALRGYKL